MNEEGRFSLDSSDVAYVFESLKNQWIGCSSIEVDTYFVALCLPMIPLELLWHENSTFAFGGRKILWWEDAVKK